MPRLFWLIRHLVADRHYEKKIFDKRFLDFTSLSDKSLLSDLFNAAIRQNVPNSFLN
jgi:hypothetical protein